MGESLFLAACQDYVLFVQLLLRLFVWQNKISSSSTRPEVLATKAETKSLQCRDRGQDQDVQSQGRGSSEAFEISTEARPSQGTTAPRDGLETEASRPRPHPWCTVQRVTLIYQNIIADVPVHTVLSRILVGKWLAVCVALFYYYSSAAQLAMQSARPIGCCRYACPSHGDVL